MSLTLPIQVVVLPTLVPDLERWLDGKGLTLFRMPIDNPDDLDTYGIGIKEGAFDA